MTSIMKILMTLLTQTMITLNRHSCAQLPGKFHDQGEIDQPPSKDEFDETRNMDE